MMAATTLRRRPLDGAELGKKSCMSVFDLIIFSGFCVGHTALWVFSINRCYGRAWPHEYLRLLRLAHVAIIAVAPCLFFVARMTGWFGPATGMSLAQRVALGLVMACAGVGLVVVPLVTIARLLRRRPDVLLSNHTETIDIARALNRKPIGHRGKLRYLCHLPGNEVFRVDFNVKTLLLPRLPAALEGLSILHLTDVHYCGTPDRDFHRFVIDRCNAWQPDLVAVTGDLVDSWDHHRWVVPLLGRLKYRDAAYAILGNHDSWHDPKLTRRRLRKIGMTVLENAWKPLTVRGEPMVVVGHEGPWFGTEPDLSACPEGPFRLCLSHTPDNIGWCRKHGIDLVLAGHVHGGQVRFPVIGSVFVPSRYGRQYDCGTFVEAPTVMHVGRGLAGREPLRYLCRPEVTLLVLRRSGA
jgi:predicted MPP superfamily phosphohydrolase